MGLDISNYSIGDYECDLEHYINDYIIDIDRQKFLDFIENTEHDKILEEVSIDDMKLNSDDDDKDKCLQNFIINIEWILQKIRCLDTIDTTKQDITLAKEYEYLLEDPEVIDSRMGSYSTIHFGRDFACLIEKFYLNKGESIETSEYKITKEEVIEILLLFENGHMPSMMETLSFDNFCNHSDCEDIYVPTQKRRDFEIGSSILLLKELDLLWKIGAVDILKEILESTKEKYTLLDYAPVETKTIFYAAETIEWVIRKMMYHAVCSVIEDEIISFG